MPKQHPSDTWGQHQAEKFSAPAGLYLRLKVLQFSHVLSSEIHFPQALALHGTIHSPTLLGIIVVRLQRQ